MDGLVIRPVPLEDVPALHRIQLDPLVLPFIMPLPSLRLTQLEDRLRPLEPDHHYVVADVNGDVRGFAGMRQHRGRQHHAGLLYLAVASAYHGQGIGSALLTTVLDLADNWLRLERLELTVLATNPRAQALYARFGFVIEGQKRGSAIAGGALVDAILMARYRPGGPLSR
jgi:putative acetyltransferase